MMILLIFKVALVALGLLALLILLVGGIIHQKQRGKDFN
jgi:hypothetical protein